MINIEKAVNQKFPSFASQPKIIRQPTVSFLKKVIYQDQVNDFLVKNKALEGFEFIDAVFDYFNFSYSVSSRDRANIPAEGRLIVIANHPIGSLDGLALLKLVGEVRGDVKIIANELLMNFTNLHSLFIPVDNMGNGSALRSYKAAIAALERDEAVIIFPAGEVSRAHPTGVKDTRWRPGFLHFARKTSAPILPIHVGAKNSLLFYGASMLFKPLGTALLAHEMFNKRSHTIQFSVGETIPSQQLTSPLVKDKALVKRLKKHVYRIGKKGNPIFETVRTISHPEDRQALQEELKNAQLLGETRDANRIYLFDAFPNSAVMREIGRLREVTFRKVGEGTGSKRDLDDFDQHYRHLVLWDRENLEIAGAYRLGEGRKILETLGEKGFYTNTLFNYKPELKPYLTQGIELGRSFVNSHYWGKASLDYLWQGIGAYLQHHPEIRYLFGPVSMSANYPRELMDALVYFYQCYHASEIVLVTAPHPYELSHPRIVELAAQFEGCDREKAFDVLQALFVERGFKVPILFKQYAALYEDGGFQALAFSIDPDFGDCLDGLCIADLHTLKPSWRKRYIGHSKP
jgi:putative hemolysin